MNWAGSNFEASKFSNVAFSTVLLRIYYARSKSEFFGFAFWHFFFLYLFHYGSLLLRKMRSKSAGNLLFA